MQALIGATFKVQAINWRTGITLGGANITHRRWGGFLGLGTTDYQASIAFGTFSDLFWVLGSYSRIGLKVGYTWVDASSEVVYDSRTEVRVISEFARPFWSIGGGVGIDLDSLHWDTSASTYSGYITVSVASRHPFANDSYNEFNPGLGLQLRLRSGVEAIIPFVEAGAYQYSMGDLATYVGLGSLWRPFKFPAALGLVAGVLGLYDVYGVTFYPLASPRLTYDTPIGSASVLFLTDPSNFSSSAFGLQLQLPIF
jgi:hypothetical protein